MQRIDVDLIMSEIRKEIKEKGYKEEDLKFQDIPIPTIQGMFPFHAHQLPRNNSQLFIRQYQLPRNSFQLFIHQFLVKFPCRLLGPTKFMNLSQNDIDEDYKIHYYGFDEGCSFDKEIEAFYMLNPNKDGVYLNYGCGCWSKSIHVPALMSVSVSLSLQI